MLVVFGKIHMMDYARTYQRKRQEDNVQDVPLRSHGEPRKQTVAVLKELGVPVKRVRSLNYDACAQILHRVPTRLRGHGTRSFAVKHIIASVPTVSTCTTAFCRSEGLERDRVVAPRDWKAVGLAAPRGVAGG